MARQSTKAPAEVRKLVRRFQDNRDQYAASGYNETQLRREFVDPLFTALDWDVANKAGYAEAYKDVVHEDAIKIGGATKAPDYCFRVGGTRKFFVETKRPATRIKDDETSAFQLRRYAWSAKLPLSILTNFAELAVYDCRVKPDRSDPASTARILYLTCEELEPRWDELAGIFAKESVLKGSFDRYAESTKAKRGTAEVDDAFLKEIESWRDLLARNLALRNPELSQRELNFAVQRTIDRLIFLRICEDRGIEHYGALQALLNGENIYGRLSHLFRRADERYNSGLFHFRDEKDRPEPPDELTLGLTVDDKVLKDIIRRLYYPDSPYEFSVLPADILGQVYEQFLGKVIRLTAGHRAKVEEKPEVRKAGGVYYTPTYIVDYIVEHTVGVLLEGKTPQEVGGLTKNWRPAKTRQPIRVLDPACGSGSFLLGAYQYLLDWYRDRYIEDGPEAHAKGRNPRLYRSTLSPSPLAGEGWGGGTWRLTTAERKRILLTHIYGVDIDPQAVEVTKLSLLLKVLEGETDETLSNQLRLFQERALPDLADNIKCGNSLIGPDFFEGKDYNLLTEEERYRINPFDWHAEFPHVFRSSPSPRAGEAHTPSSSPARGEGKGGGPSGGFDAVIGNPPYDVLEKDRLKTSWPHEILARYVSQHADYAQALGGKTNLFRFFLVRALQLSRVSGHLGMIVPLALLADVSCASARRHVLGSMKSAELDCFPQKDIPSRRVFEGAKLSTVVVTGRVRVPGSDDDTEICVRVYPRNLFTDPPRVCSLMFSECFFLDPKYAPVPLVDEDQWQVCKSIHTAAGVVHLGTCREIEVRRGEINQTVYREYISPQPTHSRLVKGVEVGRYHIRDRLSQSTRQWFDEVSYLKAHSPKSIVNRTRIAMQRITGVDEKLRIVATLVDPPAYLADSANSVAVAKNSSHSLNYILGLLNSQLFQWRFKVTSTNNNVGTNELDAMPFRTIDFSDADDRARHDKMVNLVQTMLDLHKQLAAAKTAHDKTTLQRQITATDHQIDQLVYELYGLTAEEIKIVEDEGR